MNTESMKNSLQFHDLFQDIIVIVSNTKLHQASEFDERFNTLGK